jgi:hypothetical protein
MSRFAAGLSAHGKGPMIRTVKDGDKVAKLRALADRKGVHIRPALHAGCFHLYDSGGLPIITEEGTRALSLGQAISFLMRMPNAG